MKWPTSKPSVTGVIMSGAYFTVSLVLVVWVVFLSVFLSHDTEGQTLLFSLPLLPYELALSKLRLLNSVPPIPWTLAYVTIFPAILAVIYLLGWAVGRLCGAASRLLSGTKEFRDLRRDHPLPKHKKAGAEILE
jgi:uncharacterized membrane protein